MPQKTKPSEAMLWARSPVSNLVRYVPSGVYFARVRVGGKLIRRSLKTDVFSVAQLRLGDLIKRERKLLEDRASSKKGRMSFSEAAEAYRRKVETSTRLKPGGKLYRLKCINALLNTWPGPKTMDVRDISEDHCEDWAAAFAGDYSASVYNNTVGTLRHILNLAVKDGVRYGNPALVVKKRTIPTRELRLPERGQFARLIEEIRKGGGWCSRECADLVQFLAYGGFRKGEAAFITWGDCDFARGKIVVRGHPELGTKNGEVREVPMIPDMLALLERLRAERESETPETPVMKVRECQKAMDRAAKVVGIKRITHHDLRHLFATQCIESGVDIPTVSRWLGHKDGGALAMKVYGHLRDRHSVEMAQRVKFGP